MECKHCDGDGRVRMYHTNCTYSLVMCSQCNGSGEAPDEDGEWELIEDWEDEPEEDEEDNED